MERTSAKRIVTELRFVGNGLIAVAIVMLVINNSWLMPWRSPPSSWHRPANRGCDNRNARIRCELETSSCR
jgi:hypothetical protein